MNTIESYDDVAEGWASRQKGGHSLAHDFLEKPAIYSMLPDLQGKAVLCLGCGSGEECAELKARGAERVVGIDASRGLIEQAKYTYPQAEFFTMDMRSLDFPDQSFDFVYSSLAMHYIEDWKEVLSGVKRVLKPNGYYLFSTHHPVKWGAEVSKEGGSRSVLLGYERKDDGSVLLHGDYLNSRSISENIRNDLKVTFYHKSISQMFKEIKESGFEIEELVEPIPLEAAKKERADFYEAHSRIPMFLILKLKNS